MMLENRLRKLHNEEQRLQKQIRIAQKHSEFADQVKQRRENDKAMMDWHKYQVLEAEERQRRLNSERRNANKMGIVQNKNAVLSTNATSRQNLKQQSMSLQQERMKQTQEDHYTKMLKFNKGYQTKADAKSNENRMR